MRLRRTPVVSLEHVRESLLQLLRVSRSQSVQVTATCLRAALRDAASRCESGVPASPVRLMQQSVDMMRQHRQEDITS
jgi:hypothetical protein